MAPLSTSRRARLWYPLEPSIMLLRSLSSRLVTPFTPPLTAVSHTPHSLFRFQAPCAFPSLLPGLSLSRHYFHSRGSCPSRSNLRAFSPPHASLFGGLSAWSPRRFVPSSATRDTLHHYDPPRRFSLCPYRRCTLLTSVLYPG